MSDQAGSIVERVLDVRVEAAVLVEGEPGEVRVGDQVSLGAEAFLTGRVRDGGPLHNRSPWQ